MPRLPKPGGDDGEWGKILNDYLSVEHESDGSLKRAPQLDQLNQDLSTLQAKADELDATRASQALVLDITPDNERQIIVGSPDGPVKRTADYDQVLRRSGPDLFFRRTKEAYLNDRNDIDSTGSQDIGLAIQTYLDEYASKKIYRVYLDTGVYKTTSTIVVPRAMLLEGPMRKGQSTYPIYADNKAEIKAGASGITLLQFSTDPTTGGNGAGLRGLTFNLGRSSGFSSVIGVGMPKGGVQQFIEHCAFANGASDSTAVNLVDMLYFTFNDNSLSDLYGYGLRANHSTTYYGINVGTIERNLFSGREGAFQASGIFTLRDNDFESGSGSIGPAVTIGEAGMHTDVIVEGNYFEMSGASQGILVTGDSRGSFRRNDVYGGSKDTVGSYGLKFDTPQAYREVVANSFNRFETGLILSRLTVSNGGELVSANVFFGCTTPVSGGAVGYQATQSNPRPTIIMRGDGRITYEGALTGGAVLYSGVSSDRSVNLSQGNIFHIQATANITLTVSDQLYVGQIIIVMNTGTGTISLPWASWRPVEGTDAFLQPGETRTFVSSINGWGGATGLRESGSRLKAAGVRTATFTADASANIILCDATSGAISANLPSAALCPGRTYTIKKVDGGANSVTVDPSGSQTVDGAATYVLSTQFQFVSIVSDGTSWMIVGKSE